MSNYQIECISLSKHYHRNQQNIKAVDNVNLCISKNELVILKGRSGAGKSTLLNLMSGLIKPTDGKVLIDNAFINELPNKALSVMLMNQIGIIFQSFNLLPTYTIYENIEIALPPDRSKEKLVNDKIMSFLDQFNLSNKAHLLPSELSVGQQQKVAIVRTLIKQPSVIFADEPTGSVDDETAIEIIEHLASLKKDQQVTVVIATHGNLYEKYADKVYVIENGSIKE